MTFASPLAPYARVKAFLKDGLASGRWPPGTLVPSEAELVAQFGVSRMTANRAVRELQAEGLLDRLQGVGTFAAQPYRASSTLTIRDLHEEIAERGGRHSAEACFVRAEAATETAAKELGLSEGDRVFHSLILHRENDVPLLCEDRYVNPASAPDYLSVDFSRVTPTQYLLSVAPLWEASYSLEATRPTAEEARLLQVDLQEPCLVICRKTESQGRSITWARLVYPGSRYAIEGSFRP